MIAVIPNPTQPIASHDNNIKIWSSFVLPWKADISGVTRDTVQHDALAPVSDQMMQDQITAILASIMSFTDDAAFIRAACAYAFDTCYLSTIDDNFTTFPALTQINDRLNQMNASINVSDSLLVACKLSATNTHSRAITAEIIQCELVKLRDIGFPDAFRIIAEHVSPYHIDALIKSNARFIDADGSTLLMCCIALRNDLELWLTVELFEHPASCAAIINATNDCALFILVNKWLKRHVQYTSTPTLTLTTTRLCTNETCLLGLTHQRCLDLFSKTFKYAERGTTMICAALMVQMLATANSIVAPNHTAWFNWFFTLAGASRPEHMRKLIMEAWKCMFERYECIGPERMMWLMSCTSTFAQNYAFTPIESWGIYFSVCTKLDRMLDAPDSRLSAEWQTLLQLLFCKSMRADLPLEETSWRIIRAALTQRLRKHTSQAWLDGFGASLEN